MNTYIWSSKLMEGYRKGFIVVSARNLREAREKATQQVKVYFKSSYDYWFDLDMRLDPDFEEEFNNRMAEFEADIAAMPLDVPGDVMFIYGGD